MLHAAQFGIGRVKLKPATPNNLNPEYNSNGYETDSNVM